MPTFIFENRWPVKLAGRIGLKAVIGLQGQKSKDLSSLRKKLTYAETCPLLSNGRSGCQCKSDHSVAPVPRLLTVTNSSFRVPQIHTGQFFYCLAVHFPLA
jgi:hypothetical protein